jgi:hypothetical protein
MLLLLLFNPQSSYLLSSLLSQPLHVSKRSLDGRVECSGGEDIFWVLEQSVIMLQSGELIARPWKSAWTPVEVEEQELSLYLQLWIWLLCKQRRASLGRRYASGPGWRKLSDIVCYAREGTYEVYDLAEVNFYAAFIHVGVPCRVMDGLQQLALVRP